MNLVTIVCIALGALDCPDAPVGQTNEPDPRPHLYVIGDSTASNYPDSRHPLTGWGEALQEIFQEDRLCVVNAARSGRSSKSFYDEGAWNPVRDKLRKGDYVFIQFGHNDSKKADPKRYTEPEAGYQEYLQQYIGETRARGAVPVLVTSIYRNAWEPDGRVENTHGGYPDAMRALARREDVPLLDLHAMTGKHLQALGPDKSGRLFLHCKAGEFPAYPEGKTDNTHLCEAGAREICRMVAKRLATLDLGLKTYLKPDAEKVDSP